MKKLILSFAVVAFDNGSFGIVDTRKVNKESSSIIPEINNFLFVDGGSKLNKPLFINPSLFGATSQFPLIKLLLSH